jgi:hypothetical protein
MRRKEINETGEDDRNKRKNTKEGKVEERDKEN